MSLVVLLGCFILQANSIAVPWYVWAIVIFCNVINVLYALSR